MKICPSCSFSNDERFPTCVFCHTPLVDVPSTPSADPDHPEHERRAIAEERFKTTRRQIQFAAILYALIVTFTAVYPGGVANPLALLLYFASGIVVAAATARGVAGQFSASALQGLLRLVLIFSFGPLQIFIIFMLVGHVILPGILWHWINLIYDASR